VEERPCVCNGQNEFCCFCDGRGYVPSNKAFLGLDLTPGIRPTSRGRRRYTARVPIRWINRQVPSTANNIRPIVQFYSKCTKCGVPVREDRLARHLTKCLVSVSTTSKGSPKAGTSSGQNSRTLLHAPPEKNHLRAKLNAKKSHHPLSSPGPNDLVKCAKCGVLVKRRKLQRHLRKCPVAQKLASNIRGADFRSTLPLGASAPQRGMPATSRERQKSRAYDQVGERDRLDRTKNYGFPAREQGRYGSHSAHDGFDDESGPE